jgi:cysteinyl-tRNA synthetase
MNIKFFNTSSKTIEIFQPLDSHNVTMYVCGPTVYDRPHIGNARSVVVYDVLYRLLIEKFGKDFITYVRNITDVDDKINIAATEKGVAIQELTEEVTGYFHEDISALNCLSPNIEPRATGHINEMIAIIEGLIISKHAYVAEGHVYFRVSSFSHYGELARKNSDSLIAGSRIAISEIKEAPEDFVLWKPVKNTDDPSSVFQSPWGLGRPGWHIECSAMSTKYLGADFDIHGGGIDLIFPHHTNEVAQSCCYNKESNYAKYWIHNGFVTVDGEKMSKSLGNFFTVRDLLSKGINGEVIRYVYLSTHYRKPLNWTDKAVDDAKKSLDSFYRVLSHYKAIDLDEARLDSKVEEALCDDLNVPLALSIMHEMTREFNKATDQGARTKYAQALFRAGSLLGLFYNDQNAWFQSGDHEVIKKLIEQRNHAKLARNWSESDRIREELKVKGIILEDHTDGTTTWRSE